MVGTASRSMRRVHFPRTPEKKYGSACDLKPCVWTFSDDEDTLWARIHWVEHHGSRSIVHADLGGTIIKATVPAPTSLAVLDSRARWSVVPRGESILDVATDSFFWRPEENAPYEKIVKAIESTLSG